VNNCEGGGGGERKGRKNLDGGVIPSFAEDEEDDEDDGEDEEDGNNHNDNDSPHGEARAIRQVSTRASTLLVGTVSRVKFLEVAVTVLDGARVGVVVGIGHSIGRFVIV
jgi:hypothetical protein